MHVVFTLIFFSAAHVSLILGIFVLSLNFKDKTHRIFFLLAITTALWNFLGMFIIIANTKEAAWFYFRIASIPAITWFPLLVHFTATLAKTPCRVWLSIAVFLLALPVYYRDLTSTYIFADFIPKNGTWETLPAFNSFWMYYWLIIQQGMIVISLILVFRWMKRTASIREKKQARIFFLALLFITTYGAFEVYVQAPLLGTPSFSPVVVIVLIASIWYAMVRYRMLSITDRLVSKDILENMDAFICMIDREQRIVMCNRSAESMLGLPQRNVVGKPVTEIFGSVNGMVDGIDGLLSGRFEKFSCNARIGEDGKNEPHSLTLKLSMVDDRAGDKLGILILGKEIKGLDQFLKRFRITYREWETIQQILSGATNRKIAESLGITARTLKAHITSIYNKLGVPNKLSLHNKMREYDLESGSEL